ncbi:EmrB/QacA subfamily drug resistance transporter [Paraburkholderia sp. GAS199]
MFLVLLCVSVPSFMINLDSNIVAVSLPSIAHSLHADFSAIEWVISAYTLTFASLVMPSGALADRYGRKRMLILGLCVFTLASLACGAATSVAMLNGARAIQGIGAAMQLSAALATLSHSFRGPARAKAFAFWGSVIGVAIALGPVAGGFITQVFGWQWAFYMNIPVGALMIALTIYAVEESGDPDATRIDILGFLTFSSFLFLTTLALISGNRDGWGNAKIAGEFAAAAVLFIAFVVVEKKQARPMLDLKFFRKPTYVGANITGVAYASALLTMLTFLPVFLQSGLGNGPQKAGLLMLPMAIPLIVIPRVVATYLAYRLSGRALLTMGLLLIAVGLSWMAMNIPRLDYLSLLGGMLVAGCGAGILNGEIAKVSMAVIPPERAGMASGVSGTARFSGIVIGFAALGAVLFASISRSISSALPASSPADNASFIRSVAAGNLNPAIGSTDAAHLHELAIRSFAGGYQTMIFAAAILAACAALVSWLLVRYSETMPISQFGSDTSHVVAPVE